MRLARDLGAVVRSTGRRRWLAIEALGALLRARLDTARAPAHYTKFLGEMGGEARAPDEEQQRIAVEIGRVVANVAARMPFRALCLQQALAVRRMLDRRGVPAVVYLGLAKEAHGGQRDAHAWVEAGSRVVSGNMDLDRFAVIGVFA